MEKVSMDYKTSGVDKNSGYDAVQRMKKHVVRTFHPNVLTGLGSFGALYNLGTGYREPVLVSGTDGVGTKLKVAFMMDKHDTVGQDLVAMCANDILCQGAKPLFFLDYIATDKVVPQKIEEIVKGIATACVLSDLSLVGGETAEMPGMYGEGEYDLAGFAVGVCERDKIITGEKIAQGDVLIGLPSSGLHSNGFSLIRKALFEKQGLKVQDEIPSLGTTLGEALLTPTTLYAKAIIGLLQTVAVHGLAHITGGGFIENIPRMYAEGLCAQLDLGAIPQMPLYTWLQEVIEMEKEEWYGTFNMGIGMVLAVAEEDVNESLKRLSQNGAAPVVMGKMIRGNKRIML